MVPDIAATEPLFADAPGYGPGLVVPLRPDEEPDGVLIAANAMGGESFAADTTELVVALALQAALTLQLAEARQAQQRLALYADRDRIARDLHDLVIQRLFATGMSLESVLRRLAGDRAQPRLHRAVDDLDQSIRDIRGTIFALQTPRQARRAPGSGWSGSPRRSPRAPGCAGRPGRRSRRQHRAGRDRRARGGRAPRGRDQRGPARGRHDRGRLHQRRRPAADRDRSTTAPGCRRPAGAAA